MSCREFRRRAAVPIAAVAALVVQAASVVAFAQQATPAPAAPAGQKDHVAAIKQSLQASNAALRQYEWIETTAVSMKGEEKSRTQARCYYGADGKMQKVPIGGQPAGDEKKPRGLRGKIVENKKEEVSDSVKEASALVKQYVPPDPARIQAAKDEGRLSITPPDAKGMAQVVIKDYVKAGDSLALALNVTTDTLAGVTVSTFTDQAKDAVGMTIGFASFTDGTIYAATTNLDIAKENLAIAIENTGYKKLSN